MRKTLALLPALFVLGLCAASCSKPAPQEQSQAPAAAPAAPASLAPNQAPPTPVNPALMTPEKLVEKAPDEYKALFRTVKGNFIVEVHRDWAPNGADRFYNLVKNGYFDGVPFFRVVPGFMVQFGINGNPDLNARWRQATIPDDPNKQSNKPGFVTFATAGPNTRTTQVFINFGDNAFLDGQGFSPFGKVTQGIDTVNKDAVVDGMDIVRRIDSSYGDAPPQGRGPDQGRLQNEGNAYVRQEFPHMDYVKTASILK